VYCSVFSCHRNVKPFLIKRLQVSALLSIVPFVDWNFLSLHVVLSSTLKVSDPSLSVKRCDSSHVGLSEAQEWGEGSMYKCRLHD